jgi:outer membrane murein-binding lipoprotein Lpp
VVVRHCVAPVAYVALRDFAGRLFNTLRMSARDQDSGEPSAASASSSPPTAEEQRRTLQLLEAKIEKLESKIEKLESKIEKLESKIAEDEAEIKTIKSEAERLKRLDLLGKDKDRLQDFEQDVRDLRKKIEELSAPVEQPTAAGGRSPTLCQPLRSHIGLLASQALRALLLLREYDSPFYLCAQPLHRHWASQPCAPLAHD